ncbi:MAG: hypothetical protein VYE64_09755 [Planctomycetota bacterium]|nr:hypothetical protein [Planctomycetota bacterium]
MNTVTTRMRFALFGLMTASLILLCTACDLGTYSQRFEKSKSNRPPVESIVSAPRQQAAPPAAPTQSSASPSNSRVSQPLSSQNRDLPAAAVGGGGG